MVSIITKLDGTFINTVRYGYTVWNRYTNFVQNYFIDELLINVDYIWKSYLEKISVYDPWSIILKSMEEATLTIGFEMSVLILFSIYHGQWPS